MILNIIQNSKAIDTQLDASDWNAGNVQSRREFLVSDRLKRGGGNTFLPFSNKTGSDKKKFVHLPPFPGHLFVHADIKRASQEVILAAKCVMNGQVTVPERHRVVLTIDSRCQSMVAKKRPGDGDAVDSYK